MPGSPVLGMVKVAALPTGTSLAGPSRVPEVDDDGVVVVGDDPPPGTDVVGEPIWLGAVGAGARPITRPIAAVAPASSAAAPATVTAAALPSTSVRRSTASR